MPFDPTTTSIDPPPHPDIAADAVVRSLGRHLIRRHPWGPLKTLILGGISFGLWPAINWARSFHSFIVAEQRQLWHLAHWLHERKSDPELDLRPLVHDPRRGGILGQTLLLLLITVCAVIGIAHATHAGGIVALTYGYRFHHHGAPVYLAWVSMLTLVYILQAGHVHRRYANLCAYVDRLNVRLQAENLPPVAVPALTGRRVVLWLLVVLVGLFFGAIWIIPAAVVGSLQATYMFTVSRLTRRQMSARIHQLLTRDHPDKHIPVPMHARPRCQNPTCCAVIPEGATFCPRCGERRER